MSENSSATLAFCAGKRPQRLFGGKKNRIPGTGMRDRKTSSTVKVLSKYVFMLLRAILALLQRGESKQILLTKYTLGITQIKLFLGKRQASQS